VLTVVQVPFEQVWPEAQHIEPQIGMPLGHAHALFWQTAPEAHRLPQVPQLSASLVRFAHAPPAHCMVPAPHVFEHALLLQTCPV
jgi:hypothetical protein